MSASKKNFSHLSGFPTEKLILTLCLSMKRQHSYRIEMATLSDCAAILDIQKNAYLSEATLLDDFTIPPLQQSIDHIKAECRQQSFFKAVEQNTIIGAVRAYSEQGTCFIGKLIVTPEKQNRGVGKNLLRYAEGVFSQCSRYELFTSEKSTKNMYIYENSGYRIYHTKKISEKLTLVYLEKYNTCS